MTAYDAIREGVSAVFEDGWRPKILHRLEDRMREAGWGDQAPTFAREALPGVVSTLVDSYAQKAIATFEAAPLDTPVEIDLRDWISKSASDALNGITVKQRQSTDGEPIEQEQMPPILDSVGGDYTSADVAQIIAAVRSTPIHVDVTVQSTPPGDAVVMRDEEGNVVGVRRYPYEPPPVPPIRANSAIEDANATAASVGQISGRGFTPVPSLPGTAGPRGVLPGKASKADRMRELAKSSDPETSKGARDWLRARNIKESS